MQTAPDQLVTADGARLAFRHTPGRGPTVAFLPGLRSSMAGEKALALEAHCRGRGLGFLRLEYRGHGESSGRFEDGCVGDWLADALAVLDALAPGGHPCVLVGSSMGGWLALLAALARPRRVAGLVGIAAAPDFTEDLIRPRLTPDALGLLERKGVVHAPSAYGDPLPITRRLLEDGARHLLLRAPVPLRVPVHLLHGQEDADVPWRTSLRLAARLESPAVTVELVADGDHRLSRPSDLRRIAAAVDRVVEQAGGRG